MADYQPIRHRFIPEPKKEMQDGMIMVRWDYKGHQTFSTNHYLQHEWNQTLITKINECRIWLHRCFNTDESPLTDFNTLTTTSTSLMILDTIPYFSYTSEEPSEETTKTVGVLMNRYVVDIDYTDMLDRLYLGTEENPKLACILIDGLGL